MVYISNASLHGCHDLLIRPVNLKDIVILNKNSADYHRIINGISKYDTVNLLQKANMAKERSIVKLKQL